MAPRSQHASLPPRHLFLLKNLLSRLQTTFQFQRRLEHIKRKAEPKWPGMPQLLRSPTSFSGAAGGKEVIGKEGAHLRHPCAFSPSSLGPLTWAPSLLYGIYGNQALGWDPISLGNSFYGSFPKPAWPVPSLQFPSCLATSSYALVTRKHRQVFFSPSVCRQNHMLHSLYFVSLE